jgi:hypothetical protein
MSTRISFFDNAPRPAGHQRPIRTGISRRITVLGWSTTEAGGDLHEEEAEHVRLVLAFGMPLFIAT